MSTQSDNSEAQTSKKSLLIKTILTPETVKKPTEQREHIKLVYFTSVPCGKYRKLLIMFNYEGLLISNFVIVSMQTSRVPD